MIDLLLVLLYYFSLFMMTAGIWMIFSTVFSKDKSMMGTSAILGVISILVGVLFLTISNMSQGEDKIQNTSSNSEKSRPVPTLIP